jgi:hypothetical protein
MLAQFGLTAGAIVMTMQELAMQAMAMRNAGKTPEEIRAFVYNGANALALQQGSGTVVTETGTDEGWRMRVGSEIVDYGAGGYSYRVWRAG